MKTVLQSLTVPPHHPAMKMLNTYDMNTSSEARIVASIPTPKPLSGWSDIEGVGLGRLSKIVREILGEKIKAGLTLEAQVSNSQSSRLYQSC
jgi:hypothetical protein